MENPNWRQVVASILGVSVLGVIGYLGGARTKSPSPTEPPKKVQELTASVENSKTQNAPAEQMAESKEPKKIILDIGGAVAKPGVYWVVEGARLDELVVLAGGLLPSADRDRINLALPLRDGVKISIPFKSQPGSTVQTPAPVSSVPEPEPPAENEPPPQVEPKVININLATAQDFEGLPAIGKELAGRIVKYREGVGGFKSIEELRQVRGIGEKLFERVRAYLTL